MEGKRGREAQIMEQGYSVYRNTISKSKLHSRNKRKVLTNGKLHTKEYSSFKNVTHLHVYKFSTVESEF